MNSQPDNVVRRLAAILAADVVGYSAMMGGDEETTLRDLKALHAVVMPLIAAHSFDEGSYD